jgi:hypothetical protein
LRAGKGLVDLEQGRAFGVLGLAGRARIGHDARDLLLQLRARREQRDRVAVALAHLAAVEAGQGGDGVVDLGLGQREVLAVLVVEALRHVARHLDVLHLVAAHGHLVRVEHQDVGAHEHRVHEQAGRHVGVGVFALGDVLVELRLVGMRAVEHALAGHAGEEPGELGNLRECPTGGRR